MRPTTVDDRPAITELIQSRVAWMREYGIDPTGTDDGAVRDLAGESEDGRPFSWVFCEDGAVLGCTAFLRTTPEWGWTNQQRDESTLLITGTYTHPAYRGDKLGRLMAWWTLD
ncbi:GNAT family N-acetyltransferase [Streptomyces sp. NPDC004647]|uniref:GNAT family N-acetyltransferase n=1 Tax=Streptomyces sp. NPDC004647 TaxID=3154671 RepID=UPI00339E2D8F